MQKNILKLYIGFYILYSIFFLFSFNITKAQEVNTSTPQVFKNHFPVDIIFGHALWYGKAFQGKKMANGKKFDMNNSTLVASRTLPLGTEVTIVNLDNGKTLSAIVSDRGPYSKNKKTKQYIADIDISYAGAKILGFDRAGIANVKIKVY